MVGKQNIRWYAVWVVAFIVLLLCKTYEQFYVSFGHSHSHQVHTFVQSKVSEIYQAKEKFLSALDKSKHSSSQGESISHWINQFTDQHPDTYILVCGEGRITYWNHAGSSFINHWCPCINSQAVFEFYQIGYQNFFAVYQNLESTQRTDSCVIVYGPIFQTEKNQSPLILTNQKIAKNQVPILDTKKAAVGFLSPSGDYLSPVYANILIIIYLLVLLSIYYPFHHFAKYFLNHKNYSWAFLTIILALLIVLSLSQWIVNQNSFYHSILTSTQIHTNYFHYTLFEFIVISGIIFHLTYFFSKYYKIEEFYHSKRKIDTYIIPFFNYLATFLAFLLYTSVYKAIFVNSGFHFQLDNIVMMPVENYFLLINLLLVLVSVFLIAHKLCMSTLSFKLELNERFLVFAAAALVIVPIAMQINISINVIVFVLGSSIVIWLLDYFADGYETNILWLISWIIIISFLTSGLIFHYQNEKKRNLETEILSHYKEDLTKAKKDTTSSINPTANLIQRAYSSKVNLYIFENQLLNYATNTNKPVYSQLVNQLGELSSRRVIAEGKDYMIARPQSDTIIALSHDRESMLNAISLFSYLFSALILFCYVINFIHQKYKFIPEGLQFNLPDKPSLKNRIQFYIILGIIISFVIIALITVFFTKRSERQILEESLLLKINNLTFYLENSIASQSLFEDAERVLQGQINHANSLLDYSVEVYDNKGYMIQNNGSSKPTLERTKLLDPRFYFNYPSDVADVVITEYDDKTLGKRILAYKNLFFKNQRIGTSEVSTTIDAGNNSNNRLAILINTLLNIYVFLFLIAASLATILANSITSPLEVLGNKIKELRLGKRNEMLEWKAEDEIGELIQTYNQMVDQLDESAHMLAKSERDNAWREMAKQVAHEIKNPLTPMKLSIQYLQQMIKSGSSEVIPMTEKISQNLLEQIDGLTQIATEFGNFAKMPIATNEKLLLNEVVSNVHDLFRKREDLDIYLSVTIDELYAFCDKNQLIRVLNNLINNAIQAIPETRRGKIEIALTSKDKFACIKVKDNGVGIPEEMQSKVFLPNFTTKSSGTGLGLAMCQQIIEAVNGKIYFNSLPTHGTEFVVELPLMKS